MSTTKRRARMQRGRQITSAAIAAFRAGDVLGLHRELQLKPWEASPIDATGNCLWPAGSAGANT